MRRFSLPFLTADEAIPWGPWLIAAGLALLILATWWPALPIVSALAVLTLGATAATLARYRGSPLLRGILTVHVVVYTGLYALYFGAVCHAASVEARPGLDLVRAADLAASVWPMLAALRLSFTALWHDPATR